MLAPPQPLLLRKKTSTTDFSHDVPSLPAVPTAGGLSVPDSVTKIGSLLNGGKDPNPEADPHFKTLLDHLAKSSPAMTEQTAFTCLALTLTDIPTYGPILVHFGLLDSISHQLDTGAEESSIAALKVLSAAARTQPFVIDRIAEHAKLPAQLKTVLCSLSSSFMNECLI